MPRFEIIEDPQDSRVEPYRDIRERDLVGRRGLFVAEGEVVLRQLLAAERFRPVSVLIDNRRAAKLAPMLEQLPADAPVYQAGRAVLDAVAGFAIHRGILALGRRAEPAMPAQLLAGLGPRALVLGLYGIANHDNMGGIFRNAAAFGADAVILDAECCDPLYRKALRVSVGAALRVPFARLGPGEDGFDLFAAHAVAPIALSPAGDLRLAELRRPARTAVLLGAEGPGLADAVLARAQTVRIPMAAGFDSLNVATTSGIVLHHLTEAARLTAPVKRAESRPCPTPPASSSPAPAAASAPPSSRR